jgi:hypothetical protein
MEGLRRNDAVCSGTFLGRSFFSALFLLAIAPALADVNSWIRPTSSYWEDSVTNWSLGKLPDATQSVMITNAGWKAVAIGTNTAQKFPQSMTIQDMQIASPVDTHNVFLMNFSGFTVPLQMTGLTVGSNSDVLVQSSMLQVISTNANSGNIFLNGNFYQSDFAQVTVSGAMIIGRFNFADYYLTNGTLSVNVVNLGGFYGGAKFVQFGGFCNSSSFAITISGEYDLYGGQVNATNPLTVGSGDFANTCTFNQRGYGGQWKLQSNWRHDHGTHVSVVKWRASECFRITGRGHQHRRFPQHGSAQYVWRDGQLHALQWSSERSVIAVDPRQSVFAVQRPGHDCFQPGYGRQ